MNELTQLQHFKIAASRLINTLLFGSFDEMLSSRSHRMDGTTKLWSAIRIFIDVLFFWDDNHCMHNYIWENHIRKTIS